MFFLNIRLSTIVIFIVFLTNTTYSKMASKDSIIMAHSSVNHINDMLKKKQAMLLKTQRSHTTQYMSLYDDIADLTISKNKLLLEMDKVDDIK